MHPGIQAPLHLSVVNNCKKTSLLSTKASKIKYLEGLSRIRIKFTYLKNKKAIKILINGVNLYSVTNFFESNNVANKGLMELGGYSVPGVIMANNKVEARERAEKASLFFGFSMIAPLIFLPVLNKSFLKLHGVSKTFKNGEGQLMQLSKKYLTKDSDYMIKGIKELKEELKSKKRFGNVEQGFDDILENFKGKEGELQKKLIKTHAKVLFSDLILTGGLMGSVYWMSNARTKKKTGREGFSAEFEMADKEHIEQKAQKFKEKSKHNFLKANTILLAGSLATALIFKRGMLKNGNSFIKKHAETLDYTQGIYMSRAILALITLIGDVPNTLLSSRDDQELKYNIIKNASLYGVFFGGDLVLNNLVARILNNTCKNVNLINKEQLPKDPSMWQKLTAPLYSMEEITKKKDWSPEVLNKTKKVKSAMFWGNFIAITGFLGFGLPYLLNKMVRKNVDKEVSEGDAKRQRGKDA